MQQTAFGDVEVDAFARVDRADGTVEFYRIANGEHVRISEAEYVEGGGA